MLPLKSTFLPRCQIQFWWSTLLSEVLLQSSCMQTVVLRASSRSWAPAPLQFDHSRLWHRCQVFQGAFLLVEIFQKTLLHGQLVLHHIWLFVELWSTFHILTGRPAIVQNLRTPLCKWFVFWCLWAEKVSLRTTVSAATAIEWKIGKHLTTVTHLNWAQYTVLCGI